MPTRSFAWSLLVVCGVLVASAQVPILAAEVQTNRMRVEYVPPTNPAHQALYELLKEKRALEKLQEIFSPFRLPVELTLRTVGCDGVCVVSLAGSERLLRVFERNLASYAEVDDPRWYHASRRSHGSVLLCVCPRDGTRDVRHSAGANFRQCRRRRRSLRYVYHASVRQGSGATADYGRSPIVQAGT